MPAGLPARSTHVPEVKVCVTEVDEQVYVAISDNGPGVPAAVRTTLFDPFVTAGKPNGTGLGLTLARPDRGRARWQRAPRGIESRKPWSFTLSLSQNRSLPLEDLKTGEACHHAKPAAMDLRTALKESTTEMGAPESEAALLDKRKMKTLADKESDNLCMKPHQQ